MSTTLKPEPSVGVIVATVAIGSAVVAGWMYSSSKKSSRPSAWGVFTPSPGSLKGKTIVITGGTTGLGLESAKRLALGGANVILTARTSAKGETAVTEVKEYVKEKSDNKDVSDLDTSISYKILDLDDLQSVKDAVGNWEKEFDASSPENKKRIDVLLNNAGIMAVPERQLTKDGFERQFQSNHLGHFVLTALLTKKLLNDTARIINVSSGAYQMAFWSGLDLDYAWRAEPPESYGGWKSYGQSKLANILFTQELQRRADLAKRDWTVVCLHPGGVATDLPRNLMGAESFEKFKAGEAGWLRKKFQQAIKLVLKSVEQGANTQVWLAAGAEDVDAKGQYFVDFGTQKVGNYAKDTAAAARLWKESEEHSGVVFTV